ncbi:MAG: prepilin peptidase [Pseudomonadales bacterium]|nr:prepilin peptidase [Pseudomonadales bacterium]
MSGALLLSWGWLGLAGAVWLGLCVGSFLNVVIHRLPIMLDRQWRAEASAFLAADGADLDPNIDLTEPDTADAAPFNLMVPRSRCPHCGHQIRAWENVPVLSWLALRGRCSSCASAISVRYPLVELLTALCTLAVVALLGFTWLALAALAFTWTLLALTFIDFDTQLLPDQLTLPLLWLGLLVSVFGGITTPTDAIIGAVAGYGVLWSVYWGFKLVTGKEGMGYGDFKLLGAIGAWLGWQVLPATLLIAALAGLAYALGTAVTGRRTAGQPVPFGPFLAIGGWCALVERELVVGFFLGG